MGSACQAPPSAVRNCPFVPRGFDTESKNQAAGDLVVRRVSRELIDAWQRDGEGG